MSFVYIIPALLILVLGQIAIAILYLIIIAPIIAMAIAYVAKNDSKFRCAFNFREIIDKIRDHRLGKSHEMVHCKRNYFYNTVLHICTNNTEPS